MSQTTSPRSLRYNARHMFAARPFALNKTPATKAGLASRAIISKTTTIIKG